MKKILIIGLLLVVSKSSLAAGLINEMQSCQALIEFIDNKLAVAPSNYDQEDVQKVRKGLGTYDQYIQRQIVSPGLLEFNGGDKDKANQMQTQVDTYKNTLVKQLETRYPQNRLFMDHAIAVNNCAKQAVPSGGELDELKEALNLMVKLAKISG
ncbi:hypothetical protein GCM10007916_12550 [Psychromonas marina]|uniref:Uncharacterized protein n=1 Tax=Psychromonas marina TaxID=88364 RepID=A0ABQ6DYY1_9GAMM|nr:hypothetical protein [Psychromonas marina]GLS90188.1 hypothetical protein GCM10007916_12550 [Psychromonas marina]